MDAEKNNLALRPFDFSSSRDNLSLRAVIFTLFVIVNFSFSRYNQAVFNLGKGGLFKNSHFFRPSQIYPIASVNALL